MDAFEKELKRFVAVEDEIDAVPSVHVIGALCLNTDNLKLQFKHEDLFATRETPTTPPMIACVVETGMAVNVASPRKTAAPISAASMPTASTDIFESQ